MAVQQETLTNQLVSERCTMVVLHLIADGTIG